MHDDPLSWSAPKINAFPASRESGGTLFLQPLPRTLLLTRIPPVPSGVPTWTFPSQQSNHEEYRQRQDIPCQDIPKIMPANGEGGV